MKTTFTVLATMVFCLTFPSRASGEEYVLGIDSLPRGGVPKGTVVKHRWDSSRVYPGTARDYWVYVPAQYDSATPACVMVFQDGSQYVDLEGLARVPTVFDNLIHQGEMPVTIGVFINPGQKEGERWQRNIEYDTLSDTYARLLLDEILPEIGKDYNLVDDAAGRAIGGISSGGICAFTVAWEHPESFSKVISHVGSFTDIRGGDEYPFLIRKTRGNAKPIRVFLQDGENDMNVTVGDWTLGNLNMASALKYARYDYRLEMGTGGHNLIHGGAILPEMLRWIWRDYPGVKGAGDAPDLDVVIGEWDVVTNILGEVSRSVLTITEQGGALAGTLKDEKGGTIAVSTVNFDDDILSYVYSAPATTPGWGKVTEGTALKTWLNVTGNTFEGAVSSLEKSMFEIDYSATGEKRDGG